MRLEPEFRQPEELTEADVDAIVQLGLKQALLMDALQAALEHGDDKEALDVARQLVGLQQKVKNVGTGSGE